MLFPTTVCRSFYDERTSALKKGIYCSNTIQRHSTFETSAYQDSKYINERNLSAAHFVMNALVLLKKEYIVPMQFSDTPLLKQVPIKIANMSTLISAPPLSTFVSPILLIKHFLPYILSNTRCLG